MDKLSPKVVDIKPVMILWLVVTLSPQRVPPMASYLSELMKEAHAAARRARDVHPLLRAKLPAYKVTFAACLRQAWANHRRYAAILAAAFPVRSAEAVTAAADAFALRMKDSLDISDFAELARLDHIARAAA